MEETKRELGGMPCGGKRNKEKVSGYNEAEKG